MVASGTLLGLGIGLIDAGINTYIANKQQMQFDRAYMPSTASVHCPAINHTTGSKTRLATHLPGLCWGCTDGCSTLWAVMYKYKPTRVAAPGTDARENLRLALRTPTVLVASLLLVYVGTLLWATGHTVSTSAEGHQSWLQVTASVLTGRADN